MSYAVLSEQTRRHLEQERSRLTDHREQLVAEIASSTTTEIDRAIQALNALLQEAEAQIVATAPVSEALKPSEDKAINNALKTLRRSSKKESEKSQVKQNSVQSSSLEMKRSFKGMSVRDGIVEIMKRNQESYTIDDLLELLYGEIDEDQKLKAKKSLGAVLMHTTRSGRIDRVEDKPSRYRLGKGGSGSAN